MKIFISADIEGVCGVTHWDEATKGKGDYLEFAQQMTFEVNAACEGANEAGAKEIVIKDAHDSARNIFHNMLPLNTKLIKGWSGSSYIMVQELDESYDALIYIGYHSAGGIDGNPLSHTLNSNLQYIKLNGEYASEFLIHSYIAAYHNVPVVFLSGDKVLCEEVKGIDENIITVAVKEGRGDSTINIHPKLAIDQIKEGVKTALSKDLSNYKINLPEKFELEVKYKNHIATTSKANYPSAELVDSHTIRFSSNDYMEMLKAIAFIC